MSKIFYITTPIYYVNSHPHIGHAYTTIVSDIFCRFRRLFGEETYFLTGTDEHGQKIAESAQKAHLTPQKFVDQISQEFRQMWPSLHIEYDQFIRTTEPRHKILVQKAMQTLYDRGEIYQKEYEGLYCVGCERFLNEEDLVEGLCADHQVAPQRYKETNHFFKMSAYQDWLLQTIEENPAWIHPKRYRNEVLQFLQKPLQDLSISRPKSRLSWGVELPFDSDFVTYVWVDALLNYPNALQWPQGELYRKYWPHVHHMIGKDILKTHAIYWPCVLKAAGLPVFKKLVVHGHWISSGSKMSKSLGNVIDPLVMKDRVGVDALRYFLARDMSFGEDANFTEELVLVRYNGDLANNIGNLISRSISLSRNNFASQTPPKGIPGLLEKELHTAFEKGIAQVNQHLLDFELHKAIGQIATLSSQVNKYLDTSAPWTLAKQEDKRDSLATVLYTALDAVRVIVQLLFPVMPEKMKAAWHSLGLAAADLENPQFGMNFLPEGLPLPKPTPLFPKIKPVVEEPPVASTKDSPKEVPPANEISIDDFSKIELKVGKILACVPVKKSEKLLHSQIDLGEDTPRSIVSGIAQCYAAEALVGRNVLVVSNLKPAKLRGVLSEGMILCTVEGDQFQLVEPPAGAAPGTLVQ